jgi:hypothetical protein
LSLAKSSVVKWGIIKRRMVLNCSAASSIFHKFYETAVPRENRLKMPAIGQ